MEVVVLGITYRNKERNSMNDGYPDNISNLFFNIVGGGNARVAEGFFPK
jgi:hypothetical protein